MRLVKYLVVDLCRCSVAVIIRGGPLRCNSRKTFKCSADYSCGYEIFTNDGGVIHTPGWPVSYYTDQSCFWKITAPMGHKVRLEFTVFELDYDAQGNCAADYVEVRGDNP